MKKAFRKLMSQRAKQTELDALHAASTLTDLPQYSAAITEHAKFIDHLENTETGLGLLASEEQGLAVATSEPRYYQGTWQNSLYTEDSQSTYPASESSSEGGNEEEDKVLAEPLEDNQRYTKLQDLNRGTSGFVQLAKDTESGEVVAIKFLERGGSFSQRVMARELLNHRECALHPNIVQLKEVFLTPHHLGIVLEYADGGDLSEFIDNRAEQGVYGCSEMKARWFFQQFIVGLDYCHRLGIANRDIKLDNVLLHGRSERPIVKICDFGYSKDEEAGSICKTACGTPEYMAPEVLTTGVYEGKVADIWSCGVLLYVLLEGTFPFVRESDEDEKGSRALQIMFGRVINADFEVPLEVSNECKDLLQRMLMTDPSRRLSIAGIMDHPWFLTDLPAGALEVNSHLKMMDDVRFGHCKQTAAEILNLVNECNAAEGMQNAATNTAATSQLQSSAALGRSMAAL